MHNILIIPLIHLKTTKQTNKTTKTQNYPSTFYGQAQSGVLEDCGK